MASGGIFAIQRDIEQYWNIKTGKPTASNPGGIFYRDEFKELKRAIEEREEFEADLPPGATVEY
ncbi:MAG: hypothetical protein ACRC47_13920 [Shewanella sp.]